MSKRSFLKEFIRENKTVGSLTPSSRFLASKMLENIDYSKSKVIVELGPGTGVFTRKIVKQLPENVFLLVFELNEEFYLQIKNEFNQPNVIIIHDSADQLFNYLKEYNFERADVVISSLPLANFDESLRSSILSKVYEILHEDGKFIQFQYSLQSKKALKCLFKEVKIGFTALNIPPAFVYTCTK
jgi:phosphatidylethanolamine/phosphatidyl-N-methylethanolamine N-methyltransferase